MKDSNQYDDLNVWLMTELTRIVNEANGKKRELWNILTQSPYITFRGKIYFGIIWHNFLVEETIHVSKPWWAVLHWSTKYLVWFLAFPFILLGVILDSLYWIAMIRPTIPSIAEQHWYSNVFDKHPELCTFGIDDFVKESVDILAQELNAAYPRFRVDSWTGTNISFSRALPESTTKSYRVMIIFRN